MNPFDILTRFGSQAEAVAAKRALSSGQARVCHVQTEMAEGPPPPAFNTALLLQAANEELDWTSVETMRVAQRLFEGVVVNGKRLGLITYPRTTGTTAVVAVVREARRLLARLSGPGVLSPQLSLLGEEPRWYMPLVEGARRVWDWARDTWSGLFRRKVELEEEAAHECIRPTTLTHSPESLRGQLDADALALYTLIYDRFLDSERRGPRYRVMTIEVEYDDDDMPMEVSSVLEESGAFNSDIDDW